MDGDASPELPEAEGRRVDLVWAAATLASLALTYAVLLLFSGVGVPILLSVALAYALDPVVGWLEARGASRSNAALVVLTALAFGGVGFLVYLIPVLWAEGARLPALIVAASTGAVPWVEQTFGLSLPALWEERAASVGGDVSGLVSQVGPTVASWAASFAGSTVSWLVFLAGLSIVPFITFYLLRDWDELVAAAAGLFPRRAAPLLAARFAAIDGALASFVQGQLAVGAILAGIYVVGLWGSGVQLAVLIGLIAGFGNLVPYLGTGIGIALALASVGLHWEGVGPLVGVVLTFGVGQALEGFVITPRVVGEQVGLSPVAVIVAILAFGEVFGFVGVLLAVPSAAVLKVVLEVLVDRYRKTSFYLGGAAP